MTASDQDNLNTSTLSYDSVIDALVDQGYIIVDDFLSAELTQALRDEVNDLNQKGINRAGVGRGGDQQVNSDIRSDKTQWLDGESNAQKQLLGFYSYCLLFLFLFCIILFLYLNL